MKEPQVAKEYERRFLVIDNSVLEGHTPDVIAQAFLFARSGWMVRIRRVFHRSPETGRTEEEPIQIAIKGPREKGSRLELEWQIPVDVAVALFQHAEMKVFKSRYQIIDADTTWDVDVFHMQNEGLTIAECETNDPTSLQMISPPPWCRQEITDDDRYNNEELARHPFTLWRFIY
jgi:CYTH domain-containing protein